MYIDLLNNKIYDDHNCPPEINIQILKNKSNNINIIKQNISSNIYPITFSIPEGKIVEKISEKTKIISTLIPGNNSTYIFNNETDYYNEYKNSIFALTTKKGGWDCLRHYEILANGCIPYFPYIETCPENILYFFPKELIIKGNDLYLKLKYKEINNLTKEDKEQCYNLANELLNYTKKHLTTKNMAKNVLTKIDNKNISKILFLSADTSPDYLRCLTLHGVKELYGINCHDFPKIPHLYKTDYLNYKNLYGKGITYTNLLDENLHDNNLDFTIENDIIKKEYDIIIYGSFHRGMPFYDLIKQHYTSDKIILLCGEDDHFCDCSRYLHKIFIRELNP